MIKLIALAALAAALFAAINTEMPSGNIYNSHSNVAHTISE